MMIAAGAHSAPPLKSFCSAFHVVKRRGTIMIDGQEFEWGPKHIFTAPVFAKVTHTAVSDAFIVRAHDCPLQEKLGYNEERQR